MPILQIKIFIFLFGFRIKIVILLQRCGSIAAIKKCMLLEKFDKLLILYIILQFKRLQRCCNIVEIMCSVGYVRKVKRKILFRLAIFSIVFEK